MSEARAVLMETRALIRGGLGQVIRDLAWRLAADGWRVAIATPELDERIGCGLRQAGVALYRAGKGEFGQVLDEERPDVLLSHYSDSGHCAAVERGIPIVDVVHNSYLWHGPREDARIVDAMPHVDRYVAVSRSTSGFFSRKYGVDPGRITTIPNGIDLDYHRHAMGDTPEITRRTLGIEEEAYVFLQVGDFACTKAQMHSVSAIQRIAKRFPKARLVAVGPNADPDYRRLVEARVAAEGLQECVRFCEETRRIQDYYRLADALLLPSLTEGWSLAMTEAMFYGLPLILSEVGGAGEAVTGNDIGLLVPPAYADSLEVHGGNLRNLALQCEPANLGGLAAAMEDFCAHPVLWKARGAHGTAKVLRNYDISLTANRYGRALEEILTGDGFAANRSHHRPYL